jgi:DNA-binding transcriptional regulator YiaG
MLDFRFMLFGNARDSKTDRVQEMTDGEILAAALADPDAQPLTERQLAGMRRVSPAKFITRKLGLSQEDFCRRFRIPLGRSAIGSSIAQSRTMRPRHAFW